MVKNQALLLVITPTTRVNFVKNSISREAVKAQSNVKQTANISSGTFTIQKLSVKFFRQNRINIYF